MFPMTHVIKAKSKAKGLKKGKIKRDRKKEAQGKSNSRKNSWGPILGLVASMNIVDLTQCPH